MEYLKRNEMYKVTVVGISMTTASHDVFTWLQT